MFKIFTNFHFSKIISTFLVASSFIILISGFGIESFAQTKCTENLKNEIQSQIDRFTMLSTLPSPEESKILTKNRLENFKEKSKFSKIDKFALEIQQVKELATTKIQEDSQKLSNVKVDFGLDLETISNINGIFSGIIVEEKMYNYTDEGFGAGQDKYDFIYNSKNGEFNLNKKPEFINSTEKTPEPNITESKKQEILKQKEINTKNEPKVDKISQIKEMKKDRRNEYKVQLEQSKKDLVNANCKGLKVRAVGNYDGYSAAAYASFYSNSRVSGFANYYDNDCTNFASQSVYYGGLKMDDVGDSETISTWYSKQPYPFWFDVSRSWRVVGAFMGHIYWYENTGTYLEFDSIGYSIFDPLQTGDLLFADWTRDGTWDHAMIITGWDNINGHWEPRLSYHSEDRNNIPFAQIRSGNPMFKGLHILAPVW